MTLSRHYDSRETQDPAARAAHLLGALRTQVAHAKAHAPAYAALYRDIDAAAITDFAAFARLPVLRKPEVVTLQAQTPPLGGLGTLATSAYPLLLTSPGPIFEPQTAGADPWRMARAAYAAGFRKGDIAWNTFAYHLSPGAWIAQSALHALGCSVVPAGTGNTEQQVALLPLIRPTGYLGVPDFIKILFDKAEAAGVDPRSITKALVSGGALPKSLRDEMEARGVRMTQVYGTGELGAIAYETEARDGLVVEEDRYVEIVRPGTGDLVPDGEIGEVVVSTLDPDYPMLRLATGDLSAIMPGTSACGRTNRRLRGWLGRADQATKVKGLFVTPGQVAEIARRHPGLGRLRLVVGRAQEQDTMLLKAESADAGVGDALLASLKALTKLSGTVELVPPGSLPNDGKVIDDTRPVG